MQDKIEAFKQNIRGKQVTVLGIGISNLPLVKFLVRLGAVVTAADKRSEADLGSAAEELKALGVKLITGENYLDDLSGEYIFKTPGMRFDVPQLLEAKERGSIITSEMEVFFELCPAPIVAVTGSDGKTTTTTLIYNMLTEGGYKCHLGGNIGKPLLPEVESIAPVDIAVLELSSFQLHTMKKSPHIAVITNMSPNHLDWHKDYEEYKDAKRNIYLHQGEGDVLVLNAENPDAYDCRGGAKGEVRLFGYDESCNVYSKGGAIFAFGKEILKTSDIKIPGEHNVQNYMTAIAAVGDMVSPEAIVKVAREFGGVPHRIELVRVKDGVKYYNSSIDSSPNRTINTLKVFDKVILIAGGKDKGIPYDELGESLATKTSAIFLVGMTAGVIKAALDKYAEKTGVGGDIPVEICESYEEAVREAAGIAKPGDVVLMSNASTSFDKFRNFEERGNLFKKLVSEL
ncbi:MAG: UDP-N-acetylmuramoyl-L-alanine--D-glutamate ligase [Oscillospiraceae bacterium]|nr:UDP-N-acetylmuramoyl-L-alanine--D-glutamate ligase [Oscillospiraceae bacterium]